MQHQAITFTDSDFRRTLQPSGGATLGTDHAWVTIISLMGAAVKGGDIYGTFPTLEFSGPDDANNRGVWIRRHRSNNKAARWRRGSKWASQLGQVFPNLANFGSPPPAFL